MTKEHPRNSFRLALILVFSLAVMCWGALQNPLAPQEAQNIYMGRGILAEGFVACTEPAPPDSDRSIGGMMCAYPGSVAIAPLVTASADRFAGLYGARFVHIILGLGLVLLIYLIGNSPFYGKRGLLAATTFAFLGIPLQLSSSATTDAFAALFLGASFWFIESAAGSRPARERAFMLSVGALSLSLAVMTNYIVLFFVVSVMLYVFLRHRAVAASVFFLLPLLAALSFYGYFAFLPAWPFLVKSTHFSLARSAVIPVINFDYIFEWLSLPYLLATFGLFHNEKGRNAFFLMLLSAPAFLVPFVSFDISSIHSVVFFSLVFLAPAAALGVDHMGDLFSSYNMMSFVKQLFVSAVLVVILVFGFQQIKKLKRDYPDLSPAVTFFQGKGVPGFTVLVDSDYGSPEYVYRYVLEAENPSVRVIPIVRGDEREREEILTKMDPDYVVMDDYHSDRSYNRASLEYLLKGFTVVKTYQMTLSSGIKNIKIFQKGAL